MVTPGAQANHRGPGAGPSPGRPGGDPARPSLVRIRTFQNPPKDFKISNCPQSVGFFHGYENGEYRYSIPAACKTWACPTCGRQKVNQLADGIRDGCCRIQSDTSLPASERAIRALTLTLHPDDKTPILKAFNGFKANLANWGYHFRYKWVKEHTPPSHSYRDSHGRLRKSRGNQVHLHVLINIHIPAAVLKKAWSLATECSYIIYVQRVGESLTRPAGYLTKYLIKASQSRLFKKYEHRHGNDRLTDWKPSATNYKIPNFDWRFDYQPQINLEVLLPMIPGLSGGGVITGDPPP